MAHQYNLATIGSSLINCDLWNIWPFETWPVEVLAMIFLAIGRFRIVKLDQWNFWRFKPF